VHPVHLAREFRRHFGLSPSEHRRRGRLRRAGRLLADSKVTLVDAAMAAGYSDQAHMTRDLRSATGLTPRGLRRMAAGV
jgi:AraC family transcriptional regulator